MANLTALCPELLLSILGHLDQPSLAALAATSKLFPPYVNPILYHTGSWIVYDILTYDTLLCWFQTLHSRPDLAVLVRKVFFTSDVYHFYDVMYNCWEISSRPPLRSPSQSPSVNDLSHDEQETEHTNSKISFPILPNLEVLSIDYHILTYCCSELLSSSSGGMWSSFPKLKSVYFTNKGDVESMQDRPRFETLIPIFSIRSLETLEMVLPERNNLFWLDNLPRSSLPNLGTLHLMNSEASVHTLAGILALTPNLHTLEYNFVQNLDKLRYDDDGEEHWDEWTHLTRALKQVKDRLRDLTISVCYYYFGNIADEEVDIEWVNGLWERRGSMGSLKSFTKLEKLEIPLPVLLGWRPDVMAKTLREVLPGGLKELCLRDDLVDGYKGHTYLWTPWDSEERQESRDLDWYFDTTVDCSPVIQQLADYLTYPTQPNPSCDSPGLNTLVLKQIQSRHWPYRFMNQVAELCRTANVEGIFLCQATNNGEEVIETTVYDPWDPIPSPPEGSSPKYWDGVRCRYLYIPRRRTFRHRFCRTTPEPLCRDWWDDLRFHGDVDLNGRSIDCL